MLDRVQFDNENSTNKEHDYKLSCCKKVKADGWGYSFWGKNAEAAEVAEILAHYGIEPHEYGPVVSALRKKPQAWLDFMMK